MHGSCMFFISLLDGCLPLPDGALPDGALLDGALPDGAAPDAGAR